MGIFIVDKLMIANMAILEAEKAAALNNPVFIHNHMLRQYAVMIQILLTISIFCISVFKPWKKEEIRFKTKWLNRKEDPFYGILQIIFYTFLYGLQNLSLLMS